MKAYIFGNQIFCGTCGAQMSLVCSGSKPHMKCNTPSCPENRKLFRPPTVELQEVKQA